jgi:hypothetical protein
MATIEQFQADLRAAVRATVEQFVAEHGLPTGEAGEPLFTTIETLALQAGDAVSLEVFAQHLAQCEPIDAVCPHCGQTGQRPKQRRRAIHTRRGLDVPLHEPECYCPGCRRAFFPSVPTSGTGRGL